MNAFECTSAGGKVLKTWPFVMDMYVPPTHPQWLRQDSFHKPIWRMCALRKGAGGWMILLLLLVMQGKDYAIYLLNNDLII